jgi:hypothetical protein
VRAEKLQLVSVLDPAIDTERMGFRDDMVSYFEKRDFSKLVPFIKPGAKPTVFFVREIPHALWDWVDAAEGENARSVRAFRCGVYRVENIAQGDGTYLPDYEPTGKLGGAVIVSEEEMSARFSREECVEIGSVVYQHSFLARRIDLSYQLPASCLAQLLPLPFRSAAANPSGAAPSNAKPLEPTTPTPPTTENQSAVAGG